METFGNFIAICFYSLAIGTFCGYFGKFLPFWYVAPIKIWQPRAIDVKVSHSPK
jgi:hypothetical protein